MAEKIELFDVLKAVAERHYSGLDWRLIDETGEFPAPLEVRKASFIWRSQFNAYLGDAFDCSEPTKSSKWDNLIAKGVIIDQGKKYNYTKKKNDRQGYIDLVVLKGLVPEYSSFRFSEAYLEIKEKKQKKNTDDEVVA